MQVSARKVVNWGEIQSYSLTAAEGRALGPRSKDLGQSQREGRKRTRKGRERCEQTKFSFEGVRQSRLFGIRRISVFC